VQCQKAHTTIRFVHPTQNKLGTKMGNDEKVAIPPPLKSPSGRHRLAAKNLSIDLSRVQTTPHDAAPTDGEGHKLKRLSLSKTRSDPSAAPFAIFDLTPRGCCACGMAHAGSSKQTDANHQDENQQDAPQQGVHDPLPAKAKAVR